MAEALLHRAPSPDYDHHQPDPFALCVVATYRRNRGVAYLGFREGRFYRLVLRTNPTLRFFQGDTLDTGRWYDFLVRGYPDQLARAPTAEHPHAHEDTVVAWGVPPEPSAVHEREHLFEVLRPVANDTLEGIFGELLRDGSACYVNKGTVCSSVGVLRCRQDQVLVLRELGERPRAHVDIDGEIYDFRMEGREEEVGGEEGEDPGQEILLLLELARPFRNVNVPPPARCYIFVVAFINQHRDFENPERELEAPGQELFGPEETFTQELLRKLGQGNKYMIFSRARYDEVVAIVQQGRRDTQQNIYYNKRYEVQEFNGIAYLTLKSWDDMDPVLRFLAAEDFYVTIHQVHVDTNHGNLETMYRELKRTYANITREALKLFLENCERCLQR